nr:hypothetical protein Iba_chr10eCG11500 [Ipomoea batatas]
MAVKFNERLQQQAPAGMVNSGEQKQRLASSLVDSSKERDPATFIVQRRTPAQLKIPTMAARSISSSRRPLFLPGEQSSGSDGASSSAVGSGGQSGGVFSSRRCLVSEEDDVGGRRIREAMD